MPGPQESTVSDSSYELELYQEVQALKERVLELETFSDSLSKMLLDNQTKTTAVFKALPYMIFELSSDGTHLEFYAQNTRQLFVKPNYYIGKKVNVVLPKDVAELYLGKIKETLDSGEIQIFEYQLEFPEGMRNFQARLTVGGYDKVLAIVSEV